MRQWFYADSGQQRGPVSESELRNLLETSRIPADTKVWTEGMQDWRAASEISELAFSPYAAPQAGLNDEVVWDDYTPSGSQVRPWIRYWARTFDTLIFMFGSAILIAVLNPALIEESNDTLFGIIVLLAYNFVEPVMLSAFGYTPMKWLLKVRVRNADKSKLGYMKALSRTFKVWIKGQGLGIPLIALITQITSYNHLKNNGVTSWDQEAGIEVSHQDIEWWRWVAVLMVLAGIMALIVLGSEQA
jgi:hypothetical protein